MSLVGRVHIIKTLGISQFIFVMKSIGLPYKVLEELNSIFFKFLWSGKNDAKRVVEKVKREVMYNNILQGGMKMFDLVAFQDSIYLGWAESLLSNDGSSEWKDLSSTFFFGFGGMCIFKGRLEQNSINKLIIRTPSTFWTRVLLCWLKHADNLSNPISIFDPICHNQSLSLKSKPLTNLVCQKMGIKTIKDMINDDGIIAFEEFKSLCNNHPNAVIEYHAIRSVLSKIDLNLCLSNSTMYFKDIEIGKIGRRIFYRLIKTPHTPICYSSWQRKYGIQLDSDNWKWLHDLKEGKLITLGWKILHKIYPTNTLLYHMKIKNTQTCTLCDMGEPDFLDHFFFRCKKIYMLWEKVQKEIEKYMSVRIVLSDKIILLGCHYLTNINKLQI